jgi:hypothetical protein
MSRGPRASSLRIGVRALAASSSPQSCNVTGDSQPSVADVQQIINEALGALPAKNDLNGDGVTNVIDVQIVVNDVLGFDCTI